MVVGSAIRGLDFDGAVETSCRTLDFYKSSGKILKYVLTLLLIY